MPSMYNPHESPEGEDEPSGVTPLEIADLPADQRAVLLWMLRDPAASTYGVSAQDVSATMHDAPKDCPAIMADLAREGWLLVQGNPPTEVYKVNLRRKRGNPGMNRWNSVLEE